MHRVFKYNIMKSIIYLFVIFLWLPFSYCSGIADKESGNQANKEPESPKVEKITIFDSGEDGVNSYRIPSIIMAKDGSLLVFCEARRESWKDKSRTDIVVKRSTDGGHTWSPMLDLTKGSSGAYMDPTPIFDKETGHIFLFTNYWPAEDHSGTNNKAFVVTSTDNGQTWSQPKDVTSSLLNQEGLCPAGFGPGSGFQVQGEAYVDRLILPMRVIDRRQKCSFDVAAYSDDHGMTWNLGKRADDDNEFQIAETINNTLIYNARVAGGRRVARSSDGGNTWTKAVKEPALPGVSKGCQASILGVGNLLYFTGIQGREETEEYDERARLALYTSKDGGYTWDAGTLLYEKASGYSCITSMPDGRLAIVFETADTPGFTRKSIKNTTPPQRPRGWMRLDVILINN